MGVGKGGKEGVCPHRNFLKNPRVSFQRPCMPCFKLVANVALGLFGLSPSLRFHIVKNGYLLAMYSAKTDVK